jgi:hypothetical protein
MNTKMTPAEIELRLAQVPKCEERAQKLAAEGKHADAAWWRAMARRWEIIV